MSDPQRVPAVDDVDFEPMTWAVRAACPRCGYRLDGEVGCWADRCPLQGTCTECGDELDWSQVLVPHKYEPRWSFEHAPRDGLARTFVSTTTRLARPGRFWSELKMSDAVRPLRLAMYVGIIVAAVVIGWIALQTVVATIHWSLIQSGRLTLYAEPRPMFSQLRHGPISATPDSILIQTEHFTTPWPFILDGVTRPFGRRTQYTIRIDGRPWYVYDQGAAGRVHMIVDRVSFQAGQGLGIATRWALLGLILGAVVTTVIPLCFVLLPWTRARCGVRWRHLARIWIYAVPMMLLITLTLITFAAPGGALVPGFLSTAGFANQLGMPWSFLYPLAVPAFIFMWWGRALSCHLRVPRPWLVAGLLTLLSLLLVPFIAMGITKVLML